ncbi:hypothetical protein GHO25_18885 [Pseudomonas sp. FSL R10-1350]|uniref:Uncharacterized protein n=1 Tax=Pseudomonas helleri TaxID=1608996 RepID=A0A6A7YM04_9PSED|nr:MULTISPECIES: hypothetical protein [Pseudomonas]MQT32532.1 hypothetical protein [Pseudomonas helleri]MQT49931.1 hypothetical protein [Pseudomonas helleri]MQT92400.1 hypothetical protein [Pseudomonas helleri]MQU65181.1 hypothetical protein [Pseudomonas sp. FSL R10-1350]
MSKSFVRLDTFLSNDKKHIFSRCQFVFPSTTIGDYNQTTLTNTLIVAFEDLTTRLNKYHLKKCTLKNINTELPLLISHNIRNSCLPIGVESFDGDQAAFFLIEHEEKIALKPWNSNSITLENLSLLKFKHEIIITTEKLKKQKTFLTNHSST